MEDKKNVSQVGVLLGKDALPIVGASRRGCRLPFLYCKDAFFRWFGSRRGIIDLMSVLCGFRLSCWLVQVSGSRINSVGILRVRGLVY